MSCWSTQVRDKELSLSAIHGLKLSSFTGTPEWKFNKVRIYDSELNTRLFVFVTIKNVFIYSEPSPVPGGGSCPQTAFFHGLEGSPVFQNVAVVSNKTQK